MWAGDEVSGARSGVQVLWLGVTFANGSSVESELGSASLAWITPVR